MGFDTIEINLVIVLLVLVTGENKVNSSLSLALARLEFDNESGVRRKLDM